MSRSIHRTQRELYELERSEAVDSDERRRELADLRSEVRKKRRIKRQVRELRRSKGTAPPTEPAARVSNWRLQLQSMICRVSNGVGAGVLLGDGVAVCRASISNCRR